MAANEKTEAKADPMVKATVALGRTIHAQSTKFDDGGLPKLYGYGEEVELPASEVERLRKLGFLHLEDGTVAPSIFLVKPDPEDEKAGA